MKKILVLGTLDERGGGHAWHTGKVFANMGAHVEDVYLIRNFIDTERYVIDATKRISWKYLWYKFVRLLQKPLFAPFPIIRGWYMGIDFADADDIINRITIRPDYVVIGTHQFFLSPKELYKLYKRINAIFVFVMVDEKLLGGGCSYPKQGCRQYETGCKHCPVYPYAHRICRYVVSQKQKYLSKMKFHLVGTKYDLNKAKNVGYLKHATMHSSVGVPKIPFVKSKKDARAIFGINENDFVIMSGSVNNKDPNKGFNELVSSLRIFSQHIKNRPVTLLILGKEVFDDLFFDNIKICNPGFLDLNGLFEAYYACDVYASPSIEDSGPFMVNYAIACGRPVIAFPIGIALDLVKTKETGWLTHKMDIKEYAEGIRYFYSCSNKELKHMENVCMKLMEYYGQNNWFDFMFQ